jgi:hypothetical protein
VNWDAFGALATAGSGLVVLLSVPLLIQQIVELRRATNGQAFANAVQQIQDEEVREARSVLFSLRKKDVSDWTTAEKSHVKKVCSTYNTVAIMARHGMLPKRIIVEYWRTSILDSWQVASPLVKQIREEIKAPQFYGNFEWLANEASKTGSRY